MICCSDLAQLELMLFKNNVKTSVVVSVFVELVKHQTLALILTSVLNKFFHLAVRLSPFQQPLLAQPQINVTSPLAIQTLPELLQWVNAYTPPEIAPTWTVVVLNTNVPLPMVNVPPKIPLPVHQSIVSGELGPPGLLALSPVDLELKLPPEPSPPKPKTMVPHVLEVTPNPNLVPNLAVLLLVKFPLGRPGLQLAHPLVVLEPKSETEPSLLLPFVEVEMETVELWETLEPVLLVFQSTALDPTLLLVVSVLLMVSLDTEPLLTPSLLNHNMEEPLVHSQPVLNGTPLVQQPN